MKTLTRIVLLLSLAAIATPELSARNNRTRTIKSIDISDDPGVVAAQKRRNEAVKALREAEEKRDKAAIETAQKEKNEAQKALQGVREAAFAAAKKKQKR